MLAENLQWMTRIMQALSDDLCHFPQGENYTLYTWLRGGGIEVFFVEVKKKKKKCFADFGFFNLKNIFNWLF